MRVLGVDPGLTRCGLGVVDGQPGRASHPAGSGPSGAAIPTTMDPDPTPTVRSSATRRLRSERPTGDSGRLDQRIELWVVTICEPMAEKAEFRPGAKASTAPPTTKSPAAATASIRPAAFAHATACNR